MAYRGNEIITIGKLAKRTGLSVSAIRFYVDSGLIPSQRNAGGHRIFHRSVIRRVSFIQITQSLGFSLTEIQQHLEKLPDSRTPTPKDWQQLGSDFRNVIDQRIEALTKLRDTLDGCIGCGCLSLSKCRLYNPEDRAASLGKGPRYLLGGATDQ